MSLYMFEDSLDNAANDIFIYEIVMKLLIIIYYEIMLAEITKINRSVVM